MSRPELITGIKLKLPPGFPMNSKLASKLAPWAVVIFVIGGCGSVIYPLVQGRLESKREAAPFRAWRVRDGHGRRGYGHYGRTRGHRINSLA
jgi:hypothetical protein